MRQVSTLLKLVSNLIFLLLLLLLLPQTLCLLILGHRIPRTILKMKSRHQSNVFCYVQWTKPGSRLSRSPLQAAPLPWSLPVTTTLPLCQVSPWTLFLVGTFQQSILGTCAGSNLEVSVDHEVIIFGRAVAHRAGPSRLLLVHHQEQRCVETLYTGQTWVSKVYWLNWKV